MYGGFQAKNRGFIDCLTAGSSPARISVTRSRRWKLPRDPGPGDAAGGLAAAPGLGEQGIGS